MGSAQKFQDKIFEEKKLKMLYPGIAPGPSAQLAKLLALGPHAVGKTLVALCPKEFGTNKPVGASPALHKIH